MTRTSPIRPAAEVVQELQTKFPNTPLLALGQTVFWDEPVKAVLRLLMDSSQSSTKMVLGVHDTDYFAKSPLRMPGPGRFIPMPHNDGSTKSLWSAAGEISTLFGSETLPSAALCKHYGVPFHRLAASAPEGAQAFIDNHTEAWGWRGLVYTGSSDLIVSELKLEQVGDGMLETLMWGFQNAVQQVHSSCCRQEAQQMADTLLNWCREYRQQHPLNTLTDLFQHVLPRLYSLLLGYSPDNIEVTGTAQLLLLTPETAHLPRFRFADLFLKTATRDIAVNAYNEAVAGGEMYALDRFGKGALPFDCIVPGRGRGTLRITDRVLFVETRNPVAVALKKPVESIHDLAAVLTSRFGPHVTLVGKAVSLISMLAQEFIFVFNEEGSMYVHRTHQMNDILMKHGIELHMHPILRLQYHTWDALSNARTTLCLPEHLAQAFGSRQIGCEEFSARWREVLLEQEELLTRLQKIKKPAELLGFLQKRDPASPWEERIVEYEAAKQKLMQLRAEAAVIQQNIQADYGKLRAIKLSLEAAQRESGRHFRSVTHWTQEELQQREHLQKQISQLLNAARQLCNEINENSTQRSNIERGVEAAEARRKMRTIELESELARLRMVRYALLTTEGLKHTNHRPSAWWMPLVDSTGAWFRKIAQTTQAYQEQIQTDT